MPECHRCRRVQPTAELRRTKLGWVCRDNGRGTRCRELVLRARRFSAALTYERIRDARATLTAAAFEPDFPGARDAEDPMRVFIEAKRNLTALVQWRHGEEAFERMLGEDE